jgi:hypothetical protein
MEQQRSSEQPLSIEERLARLKNIHQKKERPPSGTRRSGPSGLAAPKIGLPLDPISFQEELAKRTAEEQA